MSLPICFGESADVLDTPLVIYDPTPIVETVTRAMIDWKETPKAHIFKVDLPGLKKEDIKVQVESDTILQISGEKIKEIDDDDLWYCKERFSGKFARKFKLPENAILEKITASLERGVLTITIPKGEKKKTKVKAISISG